MTNFIGVIGCGWLGLPLAKQLINSNYKVKGTTTSESKINTLEKEGIKGFVVKLNEDSIKGNIKEFLSDLDILIINIPPGLRGGNTENYVSKMVLLLKEISKTSIKNVVFVSSTSVYGDIEGEITEDTPPMPQTESGKQLLDSEKLFQENSNINTTIIRFGGLIGADRHPVKYLAGKKGLKNGEELVNLIQQEDCIHMITTIIKEQYWGLLFNGVYPYHPTKKEYYTAEALKRDLEVPKFEVVLTKIIKKTILSKTFLNKSNFLYTSIIS